MYRPRRSAGARSAKVASNMTATPTWPSVHTRIDPAWPAALHDGAEATADADQQHGNRKNRGSVATVEQAYRNRLDDDDHDPVQGEYRTVCLWTVAVAGHDERERGERLRERGEVDDVDRRHDEHHRIAQEDWQQCPSGRFQRRWTGWWGGVGRWRVGGVRW